MKIITQYSQNKRYLEANFALVSVQPPFEGANVSQGSVQKAARLLGACKYCCQTTAIRNQRLVRNNIT